MLLCILCIVGLCACQKEEMVPDYMSAPDLAFEIVTGQDVPQKVNEKIFQKQKEQFGFTYRDGDTMYIILGFGIQPTGGYSIQIVALKDTEDKIVVEANLVAPQPEDVVSDRESYPFIILKVQESQKNVQFRLNEVS